MTTNTCCTDCKEYGILGDPYEMGEFVKPCKNKECPCHLVKASPSSESEDCGCANREMTPEEAEIAKELDRHFASSESEGGQKHPEHICRFNDAPYDCDCFDAGYQKGIADNQKKGEAWRKGYMEGVDVGKKNLGQLRQWLNEDRITDPKKMVTNEEMLHWLE